MQRERSLSAALCSTLLEITMTSRRDRAPEPQKYLPKNKRGQPKPKWAYTHVYENGKRRMIRRLPFS